MATHYICRSKNKYPDWIPHRIQSFILAGPPLMPLFRY